MGSSMKTDQIKIDCKLTCDFEILRNSPVFAGADREVVRLFAYLAQHKKYRAGDLIIQSGREADAAFYLLSGCAELLTVHHQREVLLQKILPGAFFGELALLARFPWFFSVRAGEPGEAIVITRETFDKVLEKFPRQREHFVEKIVQLRVQRQIEQTQFILEKIPDRYLEQGGPVL